MRGRHIARMFGAARAVIEALEKRWLLGFDPTGAGAVEHADYPWGPTSSANYYYLENKRIGFMAGYTGNAVVDTAWSPADPQQYVSGARFFIKAPSSSAPTVPVDAATLRNLQAMYTMSAGWWDGRQFIDAHTDGVWVQNLVSDEAARRSVFVFDNIDVREIEGHEAFHYEGGSARRIWYRNTYAHNEITKGGARYTIKILPGQKIAELIFDNADLNASDMTRQLDQLVFEWKPGTDPANAADYLPRIWVANWQQADITPAYVIGRLKASGVPDAVAQNIVRDGLPADLLFSRTPLTVGPSTRIEAEDFDFGRQGMAYYDSTLDNENGGQAEYRPDVPLGDDLAKVDIRTSSDVDGGHEVTAVQAGEWITYTINVLSSGTYRVDARVRPGGPDGGGRFAIEFDGIQSTGDLLVPADDAWSTQGATVFLPAGVHVMRLAAKSADNATGWNLNWIELNKVAEPAAPTWPVGLSALAEPWGLIRRNYSNEPRRTDAWSGQIKLSWPDVQDEDFYIIERSNDGQAGWIEVGRTRGDVTAFSDNGVHWTAGLGTNQGIQPNRTYCYRLTAVGAAGRRISDMLSVRTPALAYTATPAAPTGFSAALYPASPASGAVQLTWNTAGDQTRGFYIERRSASDSTFTRLTVVAAAPGSNTYVDSDSALTPETTYVYRLVAYNWIGESAPSAEASITTPASINTIAAPTNLVAESLGNGLVKFTWTDRSSNEAGFRIEQLNSQNAVGYTAGVVGANVTSFLFTTFSPNVYSRYRVTAFNIETSASSGEVSFTVTTQPKPSAVAANLRASAVGETSSGRGIRLVWEPPRNANGASAEIAGDVAAYKIERSVDGAAWMEVASVAADGLSQYSHLEKGLAPNTVYYYRVRSYNRAGWLSDANLSSVIRASTGAIAYGALSADQYIQAEHFDRGGPGVAYSDRDRLNSGNWPGRADEELDGGVDLFQTDSGPVWLTHAQAGEWLQYTLTVPRSGVFDVEFAVAFGDPDAQGGTFHLEIDGQDRTGPIIVPRTGAWDATALLARKNIALPAGEYVMRLVMDANAGNDPGRVVGNFDWFRLVERIGLDSTSGTIRIAGGADEDFIHLAADGTMHLRHGSEASPDPLVLSPAQFSAIQIEGGKVTMGAEPNSPPAEHVAISLHNAAQLTFSASQRLATLSLGPGSVAALSPGGNKVLSLANLDLATDSAGDLAALLDLADNRMILSADETTSADLLARITAALASGRNAAGGLWSGQGITSSSAAARADGVMGLAAILNDAGQGQAIYSVFAGQTVDRHSILIRYTRNGDSDLNGLIDASDYFRLHRAILTGASGYRNGDSNYSGAATMDDVLLTDRAYLQQTQPPPPLKKPPTKQKTPRQAAHKVARAAPKRRPRHAKN